MLQICCTKNNIVNNFTTPVTKKIVPVFIFPVSIL